ncbi:NRDE family protein [Oceanobacillus luteolus]|uniref:NRDE family protein n=1 Tax=Oceanobacillus luteolus TaxID=1274358 RepID=A0ABW4HTD3_9BACI|nr:NRDE family protein [Oceanobacillus luteolus]MCM3739636.1 NRDE family protein [Oceanobacillus luteolus]
MCLIHFNIQGHPNYNLIVAANRDEFYKRPTEKAHFWPDAPHLLAGRDLVQKGTWLGITKEGRFAALTNIRDLSLEGKDKKSRGAIVRGFLTSTDSPVDYLTKISQEKDTYAGFNILVGNSQELFHYNNIEDKIVQVTPGTHSLSNASLNTPWPKVIKGKKMLGDYFRQSDKIKTEHLFQILENNEQAQDSHLPNTGIGLEMERQLSASFIKTPEYGTRSATVLLIDRNNQVIFKERTYKKGILVGEEEFSFSIPTSTA